MLRNITKQSSSTDVLLKHICINSQIFLFNKYFVILTYMILNFPIEVNATIYSFIARFDDEREIHIELKEKNQIKEEISENNQIKNVFTIHLGIFKSNSQCQIEINYVTELDLVNKNILRLIIPKIINELDDIEQVSYTFDFNCEVIDNKTSYVSCLSHLNAIIQDKRIDESKIYVKLSNILMEKDIIIDVFIKYGSYFESILSVESDAIMAGFISYIPENKIDHELIFLVDCSESMNENNSIDLARKVLFYFFEELPIDSQFNIICCGSILNVLFDKTITDEYSKINIKKVKKFIQNIKTDLSKTELIKPLKWLYNHPPKLNKSRQILLVTTGQISNTDETIDLCRKMATHTRIFTVGLGLSPNRALIKGIARVTNGKAMLIPPDAKVEYYVADQRQRILHPSFNNINIRWKYPSENNPIQFIIPIHSPNVLFSETRFLVYALLNETQPLEHEIKIELIENKEQQEHCLSTICIDHIPYIGFERDKTIGRLAAKALIQQLLDSNNQDNDEEQRLMLDISLKFGILCPLTTFVGIEKYLNNNEITMSGQPIQISAQHFKNTIDTSGGYIMRQGSSSGSCVPSASSYEKTERKFLSNLFERLRLLRPTFSNTQSITTVSHQSTNKEKDFILYLIEQQQFDGMWLFSNDLLNLLINNETMSSNFQLTSKYIITDDIFITALVIIVLEQRYTMEKSLWIPNVNKAKQRLLELLKSRDNNEKPDRLEILLHDLQKQVQMRLHQHIDC